MYGMLVCNYSLDKYCAINRTELILFEKPYFQSKDQSHGNQYQFTLKTQWAAQIYQIIASAQLEGVGTRYYFNQDWQAD